MEIDREKISPFILPFKANVILIVLHFLEVSYY